MNKDPLTWRMVYIFFLLIGMMIGTGVLFDAAQTLPESDPDYRAILAALQGLEDSQSTLDSARLSDFAANDARYRYGNNYNLKMVRLMLGKPDLRMEEIGFLDYHQAEIEYQRRGKELYLAAFAQGYQPEPTPIPTPPPTYASDATPMGGWPPTRVPSTAYPPYPGSGEGKMSPTPSSTKLAPAPQKAYPILESTLTPTLIPTPEGAYILAGEGTSVEGIPVFNPAEIPQVRALMDETGSGGIPWVPSIGSRSRWHIPIGYVRVLGDLAHVEKGDVEEILVKKNGRWLVIGEKTLHCCG